MVGQHGNIMKNSGHGIIDDNIKTINDIIESMLKKHFDNVTKENPLKIKECGCIPCEPYYYTPSGFPSSFSEADVNSVVITSAFVCGTRSNCPCELTPYAIYRRLAIIDNLYNTNVSGKRKFGLMELTESIWQLCGNGADVHTDATLCDKAEEYVDQCVNGTVTSQHPIAQLLNGKYGYNKKGNALVQDHAVSIITKYLFFLLRVNGRKKVGFPIYDTIVKRLINHFVKELSREKTIGKYVSSHGYPSSNSLDTLPVYIFALSEIVKALGQSYQNLCHNYDMQEFELLDFFLWRVGKIKKGDYSNLLSKREYKTNNIPQWITSIANKI